RAAEDVVFGEISTGASNDLERVSRIARDMIVQYGMSKKLPNLSLVDKNQNYFLGQGPQTYRRSEKIEQIVDEEVMDIIQSCYAEDKEILQKHRKKLEKMAQTLLEKEKLDDKDIIAILGKRA
ncbi:MAG: cell division protein FtsH, partial [Calditrichia bacterium]